MYLKTSAFFLAKFFLPLCFVIQGRTLLPHVHPDNALLLGSPIRTDIDCVAVCHLLSKIRSQHFDWCVAVSTNSPNVTPCYSFCTIPNLMFIIRSAPASLSSILMIYMYVMLPMFCPEYYQWNNSASTSTLTYVIFNCIQLHLGEINTTEYLL